MRRDSYHWTPSAKNRSVNGGFTQYEIHVVQACERTTYIGPCSVAVSTAACQSKVPGSTPGSVTRIGTIGPPGSKMVGNEKSSKSAVSLVDSSERSVAMLII